MDQNLPRDFRGIWIPREVWLNSQLSIEEKVLFLEIQSLDAEEGCYASNEYFCKFFNWNERQLQRCLAKLKNLNIIKIESFDGRRRVLRVCKETSHDFFDTSGVSKLSPRGCQNCHPSKNENLPVEPKGNLHHIVENKDKNIVCSSDPCRGAEPASNRANEVKKEFEISPLKIKNFSGEESIVKIDDLFKWSILKRKNWTSQEIHDCWKIISDFEGPIRDVFRFVEGTIDKRRNVARAKAFEKKTQKEKKCQTTSLNEDQKSQINSSEKFADRDTIMQIFEI